MKSRNLFIGIIVLFIGVVALLASLDVISFSWHVALRLWPLLLILLGVTILPINEYLKSGLLVLLLGMGCLLYYHEAKNDTGFFSGSCAFSSSRCNSGSDNNTSDYSGPYLQEFSEPFGAFKYATLDVDFGAGNFEIKPPCAELVKVKSDSDFVKYDFRAERGDDEANVTVNGSGSNKGLRDKLRNNLDIALNDMPIWTVNIETGASSCDFDFSPYKVEKIDIEAGACDMKVRLGNQGCDTELEVESGVSNIKIEVPISMGCKIFVDSAITTKDFDGFEKKGKGVWETSNYGSAMHDITIKLDCGVSNIVVERY